MKTQNEILEKLIELGYVIVDGCHNNYLESHDDICLGFQENFIADNALECAVIFDALVSECGKRGRYIVIADNTIVIKEMGEIEFSGDYTRSNICAAFMKVVGI